MSSETNTSESPMKIFTVERDWLSGGQPRIRTWEVVASFASVEEPSGTLNFYAGGMEEGDLLKISLIASFNRQAWDRFHDQEEYFADITERENLTKTALEGVRG